MPSFICGCFGGLRKATNSDPVITRVKPRQEAAAEAHCELHAKASKPSPRPHSPLSDSAYIGSPSQASTSGLMAVGIQETDSYKPQSSAFPELVDALPSQTRLTSQPASTAALEVFHDAQPGPGSQMGVATGTQNNHLAAAPASPVMTSDTAPARLSSFRDKTAGRNLLAGGTSASGGSSTGTPRRAPPRRSMSTSALGNLVAAVASSADTLGSGNGAGACLSPSAGGLRGSRLFSLTGAGGSTGAGAGSTAGTGPASRSGYNTPAAREGSSLRMPSIAELQAATDLLSRLNSANDRSTPLSPSGGSGALLDAPRSSLRSFQRESSGGLNSEAGGLTTAGGSAGTGAGNSTGGATLLNRLLAGAAQRRTSRNSVAALAAARSTAATRGSAAASSPLSTQASAAAAMAAAIEGDLAVQDLEDEDNFGMADLMPDRASGVNSLSVTLPRGHTSLRSTGRVPPPPSTTLGGTPRRRGPRPSMSWSDPSTSREFKLQIPPAAPPASPLMSPAGAATPSPATAGTPPVQPRSQSRLSSVGVAPDAAPLSRSMSGMLAASAAAAAAAAVLPANTPGARRTPTLPAWGDQLAAASSAILGSSPPSYAPTTPASVFSPNSTTVSVAARAGSVAALMQGLAGGGGSMTSAGSGGGARRGARGRGLMRGATFSYAETSRDFQAARAAEASTRGSAGGRTPSAASVAGGDGWDLAVALVPSLANDHGEVSAQHAGMERVRSSAAIKSDGNLAVLARGPSALLRQGSGHVTAGGAVPAVSYGGGAGVSNHPGLGRTSHVSSGASNAFHTASGVVGSSNTSAGGANLMGGWSMTGAMTPAAEAAFKEQEQLVSQVTSRLQQQMRSRSVLQRSRTSSHLGMNE